MLEYFQRPKASGEENTMSYNERVINCKFTRIDLCDLLLACFAAKECANDGGQKWSSLHEKIDKMIDDCDEQHFQKEA